MNERGSTFERDFIREAVRARLFGAEEPLVAGRYRLLERLGEGGMGVVYAALDEKFGLNRKVALKFVKPGAAADEQRARVIREAKALAHLSHPNVVTILDVGEHQGHLFVAMEFVDGETLASWLKGTRSSFAEIRRVMIEAGRGLSAAHAKGLVHRDFKPENVMISRNGMAKVLDFGLAGAVDAPKVNVAVETTGDATAIRIARESAIPGTPLYMAPEQIEGGEIDARADQYSFSVSLYEALYGRLPYAAGTLNEIIGAKLRGDIAAPPEGTDVPPTVGRAILRGLSRHPGERHASMDALVEDLERGGATPSKRATRAWIYWGMLALMAGASTLGGLALFLGGLERHAAPLADDSDSSSALSRSLSPAQSVLPAPQVDVSPQNPTPPPSPHPQELATGSYAGGGGRLSSGPAPIVRPNAGANPEPAKFDPAAARASLKILESVLASCKRPDGPTGRGHVRVTFIGDGTVMSAVVVGPPYEGTPVGDCVATRFKYAKVQKFEGKPSAIDYAFNINK